MKATSRRTCLGGAAALATVGLWPRGAPAQQPMPMPAPAPAWPTRPLRFVVGYPAGGLTDIIARAYGGAIAEALQQTVTVENHAGAGGMQAGGVVAKAAPDGHTWWITISAPLNQNRVYFRKLPYDPDRDFAYAAAVPVGQVVLAVPGDSKVRSLPELAEVARRERITMGNFGVGTWPHMATHQLALRHRWQVDGVPYKGEAPMWQDLVGGRVDSAVGSIFGLTPFMELGRARPIAVQTRQRSRLLPDVPTFVEHGYTDPVFELQGWIGVFAPSGTPKDIVQRLSDLVQQAASSPRVRQLHDRFALDAPWPAAEFERRNREDLPHWLALARALRIEPE